LDVVVNQHERRITFPPRRHRAQCTRSAGSHPETVCVQISFERMQAVGRRSLGQAKECGYIVPIILQEPFAVFEGLRRDEDEDRWGHGWRCYCGIPDKAYGVDGFECPPYPGQVYLVFVNDEGIAYNWRWEKSDPQEPGLPRDHATRFKKRLI
jgi:hypothetical protein